MVTDMLRLKAEIFDSNVSGDRLRDIALELCDQLEAAEGDVLIRRTASKVSTETEYPIGTEYLSAGKHPHTSRVAEVFKTFNSKGEHCRTSYLAEHYFCNQRVYEHEVCATTISRGIYRLNQNKPQRGPSKDTDPASPDASGGPIPQPL